MHIEGRRLTLALPLRCTGAGGDIGAVTAIFCKGPLSGIHASAGAACKGGRYYRGDFDAANGASPGNLALA
jgi:hypothetical protein